MKSLWRLLVLLVPIAGAAAAPRTECNRARAPYCGCESDVAKLCDAKKGDVSVFSCLASKDRAKLTPQCAATFVPAWIVDQETRTRMDEKLVASLGSPGLPGASRTTLRTWVADGRLRIDLFTADNETSGTFLLFDGRATYFCMGVAAPGLRETVRLPRDKNGFCHKQNGFAVTELMNSFAQYGVSMKVSRFDFVADGGKKPIGGHACQPFKVTAVAESSLDPKRAPKPPPGKKAPPTPPGFVIQSETTGRSCVSDFIEMKGFFPGPLGKDADAIARGITSQSAEGKVAEYWRIGIEMEKDVTSTLRFASDSAVSVVKNSHTLTTKIVLRSAIGGALFALPPDYLVVDLKTPGLPALRRGAKPGTKPRW